MIKTLSLILFIGLNFCSNASAMQGHSDEVKDLVAHDIIQQSSVVDDDLPHGLSADFSRILAIEDDAALSELKTGGQGVLPQKVKTVLSVKECNNFWDGVKKGLKRGDINRKNINVLPDPNGNPLLFGAAQNNEYDLVKKMIEIGAYFDNPSIDGVLPVYAAPEGSKTCNLLALINNLFATIQKIPPYPECSEVSLANMIKEFIVHKGVPIRSMSKYSGSIVHYLAKKKCITVLEILTSAQSRQIDNFPDFDFSLLDGNGETALQAVIYQVLDDSLKSNVKNIEFLTQFVKLKGMRGDLKDDNGDTPLHYFIKKFLHNNRYFASYKGKDRNGGDVWWYNPETFLIPLLLLLLDMPGSDLKAKNRDGDTPLHCAARVKNHQVSSDAIDLFLLKIKSNPKIMRQWDFQSKNNHGESFSSLVEFHYPDRANFWLSCTAPEEVKDEQGFAVNANFWVGVEKGLNSGHINQTNINVLTDPNGNPLFVGAVACGKYDLVKKMIEVGAYIDQKTDTELLVLAVAPFKGDMRQLLHANMALLSAKDISDVKNALRQGACINVYGSNHETLLHRLVKHCDIDFIRELAELVPLNFGLLNKRGDTVLHFTVKYVFAEWFRDRLIEFKNLTFLSKLIRVKGCRGDVKDKNGDTILHYITKVLLNNESKFALKDGNYDSSLFLAPVLNLLLNMPGMNINTVNRDGDTPLHCAARVKNSRVAQDAIDLFVRECRCDFAQKNKEGESFYSLAKQNYPKNIHLWVAQNADFM